MAKKYLPPKKRLLSDIGEFGLIKILRAKCEVSSRDIIRGIGDDSAVINIKTGTALMTSDMMLEKIHFDLSFTTFYQLGYKILAVNISDIFAMGGTPRYFLLNLGIPRNYNSEDIDELYSGVLKIAKKFRVAVVGGDTCVSKGGLVLSGTLIGDAARVINRSGARPGDGIFVTGTLGDSAMGLMLLKKLGRHVHIQNSKFKKSPHPPFTKGGRGGINDILPLLKKHLLPDPAPLKNTSGITSMIDISDGLLIDLSHICDESNVGAIIYRDKIPLSKELVKTAERFSLNPVQYAMHGGEDYVLLFTAPSGIRIKNAVRIGNIIKKGRFLIDAEGKSATFKAEGYEHFK